MSQGGRNGGLVVWEVVVSGNLDGVDSSELLKVLSGHSDWLTDKISDYFDGATHRVATAIIDAVEQIKDHGIEALETADNAAFKASRPSVLFRPRVVRHDCKWWAMYGDDHINGVFGCGKTVESAMSEFDHSWENEAADWSNSSPVTDAPFHVKGGHHE